MGILNVGTQALQANLVALQTAGNNIANVNVEGYSRQRVIMETVPGQFTGGGYIGKGVTVQTIQRNYDAFLNRQATLAATTQASDVIRADYLKQLGDIFQGGANGLGAAINDMMNAFSDVASAPGDLTARTVALTRVDETARRMRAASQSLDDLQNGIQQSLSEKVVAVNTLARNIADVNQQIARAQGNGQPPNDLLDRRDQLIRDLNQYVQTTQIPSDDGTLGIFVGGSQALVLGTNVAPLSIVKDDFGDLQVSKLAINRNGNLITLDDNMIGGGEISGLLKFQNNDLVEGRNLLGRLTLGITTAMNDQHRLGLDLDGQVGGNLFTPISFGAGNVIQPAPPASTNTANLNLSMSLTDATVLAASDYDLTFSSVPAAGQLGGVLVRRSDNASIPFTYTTATGAFSFQTAANPSGGPDFDGLSLSMAVGGTAGVPVVGDRFLLKPFSTSANNIAREFSTPRDLAVASPVAASLSPTNSGSISLARLSATGTAATAVEQYQISFTSPSTYDILQLTGVATPPVTVASGNFVSGQAIAYPDPASSSVPGFSITLTGAASTGDSVLVKPNPYPGLDGGNAKELMNLRDMAMFDGAALSDGYAGLIAQIGIRSQSANYSAEVSTSIAVNAEKDRAGVAGVNLDEEAAKLLQYQQSYQASAKMIQVAQTIFDTLIQGLGR